MMRDPGVHIIIDGQTGEVERIREIGFVTSYSKSRRLDASRQQELNVDSLSLVGESRKQVLNFIAQNGMFQAIPVEVRCGNKVYQYCIDLTKEYEEKTKSLTVKIKKLDGLDNFFDIADGLSFESLNEQGYTFPTFDTPYVIIPPNQVEMGITLSLAIFSMVQAEIQLVKDVADQTAEFIAALDISPSHAIAAGAKLAALLAYGAALTIALIDLSARLKELIFPKIRYFKACKFKDLIQVACQAKGFSFESTLLDNLPGLTFLGRPLQKDKKSIFQFIQNNLTQSFTKGYPTGNDTTPMLGNLLDALCGWFNAQVRVVNNKVRLEQRSYYQALASIPFVAGYNDQENLQNVARYNTDDAWKRYYVHYLKDQSDIHTLDNFEPTDAEYGAVNNISTDPRLDMLKGLRDVEIPFSLGTRKSELNFIENLALQFFNLIDAFPGVDDTSSLIENRIGVLQISEQFFSNSKVLYTDVNGRQPENYLDILKADSVFQNYHATEQIENNGLKIYESVPILLNFEQFTSLQEVNFILVNDTPCEIYDIAHTPFDSSAIITYAAPDNYTVGKVTTFAINT